MCRLLLESEGEHSEDHGLHEEEPRCRMVADQCEIFGLILSASQVIFTIIESIKELYVLNVYAINTYKQNLPLQALFTRGVI